MKTTFLLSQADMSGGSKVVAIYARMLTEMVHDVLVVAPPNHVPGGLRTQLKARLRSRDLTPLTSNHLVLHGAPHKILEHKAPIRPNDVPDADVIIATWWETAEWLQVFPQSKGAKTIFMQHDETYMYADEAMHGRLL